VENFTDEEKEINRIRLVNELKNFNQKEKAWVTRNAKNVDLSLRSRNCKVESSHQ
jgi:hypothetical protein